MYVVAMYVFPDGLYYLLLFMVILLPGMLLFSGRVSLQCDVICRCIVFAIVLYLSTVPCSSF